MGTPLDRARHKRYDTHTYMVAVETPSDSFRKLFAHPLLQGCVVVALALAIALIVEVPGRFPDPDSFYHGGMAELAAVGEFPAAFPWTDLATLRDAYGDLHFGYHLFLVPFVRLFDTMAGMRVATIVLFTLGALAWFCCFRALRLRGAFAWTLLLIGSAAFVFRLNLAKSQGLAFVLLAIGIACVFRRAYLGLFLTALLAAWASPHWPVLVVVAVVAGATACFMGTLAPRARLRSIGSALLRSCALIGSAAAGIAVALLVNPYFPEILAVARQQIVDVAIVGARAGVVPGQEWNTLAPLDLFRAIGFLAPLLVVAFGGMIALVAGAMRTTDPAARDTAARALALGIITGAFTVLTLRQQRHIEFLVPFAILAIAAAAQPVIAWCWPPRVVVGWREPGVFRRPFATIIVVVGLFAFAMGAIRDLGTTRAYFRDGYAASRFGGTGAWLRERAAEGTVVFHADWSDFPFLFRAARNVRYLVGLDPTFAYLADPARYRRWVAVGRGDVARPATVMRNEFRASYALLTTDDVVLAEELARDRSAVEVYRDDEATIYQLGP